MEEIAFNGSLPKPEGEYVPYTPQSVKLLSITQGFRLPLLSSESGGPSNASYVADDMPPVSVSIKFVSEDGSASVETPLAMCRYVKPEGEAIYNADVCRDATFTNLTREAHNKYIVKIINEFIRANDLGTSAGKLTCPDPPIDANKARLAAIKAITTDKLGTARKAIKYLAQFEIYCGRDYEFDDAFEKANEECFRQTCIKRAAAGKVRVRLEGSPPTWWDGNSPTDSAGNYVAWAPGTGHTFLTPSVSIVRVPAPAPTSEESSALIVQTNVNCFDTLPTASDNPKLAMQS